MKRRLWFYGSLAALITALGVYMTAMPGKPHTGPLPEPTAEVNRLAGSLRAHVFALAETIGERHVGRGESLVRARDYLISVVEDLGKNTRLRVRLEDVGPEGANAENVVLELPGASSSLIVIGAHYDSAVGAPGADDNASGVASALELTRLLAMRKFQKSIRVVLFANEEPPYFKNPGMGSQVHARGCRQRGEDVTAMLSLESIGYYSEASGSQRYPWPIGLLYPDRGNFIAFVGNLQSRSLVRHAVGSFREAAAFPSEGAALPAAIPGVDWSDHWSFWQAEYPAIMVTGTAIFRNPHYHRSTDTVGVIDYVRLARVTLGIRHVIAELAQRE